MNIKLDRTAIQDLTDRLLSARKSNLKMVLDIDHRLEQVKIDTEREVVFINDARSTTLSATAYSLSCIESPVIWCLSCNEVGRSMKAVLPAVKDKVKGMLYLGLEDQLLVEEFVSEVGLVQRCDSMEEMVTEAYRLSATGDTVLYSPASPSSEYYGDFQKRGEDFKTAVKTLS